MSSIAKSGISLSKKDLTKSRIPLVASRNVTFYHKTSGGELSIDLLALSMPSEMPTNVQATVAEISGAQLAINKKNLSLQSSSNGVLQQGLDYVVTSSTTINLIGLYALAGAEIDEIFTGTINSAPVSDLVVASARSVDKTYTLAVGQTILNLGREYQTGQNINDDIGSIKVFVNGVLAHRDTDYYEIDAGSGWGTTIGFYTAPVSLPYSVAVDFGVMSITDNDAIGTIENLAGAIKKIAVDLADVAGTSESDYYSASPSEIERRTFGDMVLSHEDRLLVSNLLSALEGLSQHRQYDLTSTGISSSIGGSFSTAVAVPYKTINGTWRMRFNIGNLVTSASRLGCTLTLTGVVFKSVSGLNGQAISAAMDGNSTAVRGFALSGVNTMFIDHASLTTAGYSFSGDVELASKPTWVA
jgi:hypothetical protein